MRLIRFVAVACMVAVSVASLGCGGDAEAPAKKADDSADTSSSTPASTDTPEAATTGTTPVSLTISGMS